MPREDDVSARGRVAGPTEDPLGGDEGWTGPPTFMSSTKHSNQSKPCTKMTDSLSLTQGLFQTLIVHCLFFVVFTWKLLVFTSQCACNAT